MNCYKTIPLGSFLGAGHYDVPMRRYVVEDKLGWM